MPSFGNPAALILAFLVQTLAELIEPDGNGASAAACAFLKACSQVSGAPSETTEAPPNWAFAVVAFSVSFKLTPGAFAEFLSNCLAFDCVLASVFPALVLRRGYW